MKLNPDCIRDILLTIEANTGYELCYEYPAEINISPLLSKYSDDEIRYHILQCSKTGFIELKRDLTDNMYVKDITPYGHEFLANIRENSVWSQTKTVAGKVGSKSLDAIYKISSAVIAEIIKQAISGNI
jgi:hypothetical protein